MAIPNQWGKRSVPDSTNDAPEGKRRRLDENPPRTSPVFQSRQRLTSPFDSLPNELVHHIFRQADKNTQGALSCCAKLFSQTVNKVRHEQAGSMILNSELRGVWPIDELVRKLRQPDKLPVPQFFEHMSDFKTMRLPEQALNSDLEIGFWLGCRGTHIKLKCEATPELLQGLAMASGWKSLSLSFPCGEWSLSDLLVPLITELENSMVCAPRELVLEINEPNGQDELTVPELLWNSRLELVGIFAGECMYKELHRFERADQLRHLEIHLPEDCDDKATDVLQSIGTRFPALQGLKITLREDKWAPGEIWQKFVESHPELSCFSLDFPANHIDEFRCNASNFRFKKFVIWMPELVDPNGELAEWIRTTDRLETLVLQSINGDEHSHDLQDLVRAIEENVSIRKIGLCEEDSGLIESDCEPTFKKFVTDLLKAISVKADFSALYLPIDLAEHLVARDQSMNVALMHLERLESINPNFILETHVAKYGSPYKIESMPVLLPAKEFVKRFPWEHSNRRPGPQDQVKLQVSMPTWGKGAFRKMLTYQSLSEDEQEEFVRDRLREADFSKEDVKVLGLISSEPEPENDYDMQLESDLAEIFGAQGSEPRQPTQ